MNEPSSTARVTRQDVLEALGDTDPFRTNAGAIRSKLGRGGNSTIQRILNEIRAERSAPAVAALESDAPPPPAPAELISSIWQSSWRYAQIQTFSRLDKTLVELEQLKKAHELLSIDYDALCIEIDELRDALNTQSDKSNELTAQLTGLSAAHAQDLAALQATHALELTKLSAGQSEWAQERELMKRDMQLKEQAHQHDREYLLNQISELKSLLYRPRPTTEAPATVLGAQRNQAVPQADLPLSEDLI